MVPQKITSRIIMCVCVLRHFSHVQLFTAPWTVAHQAPLSMEFSRQEYWSGLLFPSPGNLPDPGRNQNQVSCIANGLFASLASRKALTSARPQLSPHAFPAAAAPQPWARPLEALRGTSPPCPPQLTADAPLGPASPLPGGSIVCAFSRY